MVYGSAMASPVMWIQESGVWVSLKSLALRSWVQLCALSPWPVVYSWLHTLVLCPMSGVQDLVQSYFSSRVHVRCAALVSVIQRPRTGIPCQDLAYCGWQKYMLDLTGFINILVIHSVAVILKLSCVSSKRSLKYVLLPCGYCLKLMVILSWGRRAHSGPPFNSPWSCELGDLPIMSDHQSSSRVESPRGQSKLMLNKHLLLPVQWLKLPGDRTWALAQGVFEQGFFFY